MVVQVAARRHAAPPGRATGRRRPGSAGLGHHGNGSAPPRSTRRRPRAEPAGRRLPAVDPPPPIRRACRRSSRPRSPRPRPSTRPRDHRGRDGLEATGVDDAHRHRRPSQPRRRPATRSPPTTQPDRDPHAQPAGRRPEVEVEATELPNGTYVEAGNRTRTASAAGSRSTARSASAIRTAGIYTVSAPGVSLLVRGGAQRTPPDARRPGRGPGAGGRPARSRSRRAPGRPAGLRRAAGPAEAARDLARAGGRCPQRTARSERTSGHRPTDIEAIVEGVCRSGAQADRLRRRRARVGPGHPDRGPEASSSSPDVEPGDVVKLSAGSARRRTSR